MDIKAVKKKLGIEEPGRYENDTYIIELKDSNGWARYISILDEKAVPDGYPEYSVDSSDTDFWTEYYRTEIDGTTYLLILEADLANNRYQLRISCI